MKRVLEAAISHSMVQAVLRVSLVCIFSWQKAVA
jgi:hypothetical protein